MLFIETTSPLYGTKHLLGLLMMVVIAALYLGPLLYYKKKMNEKSFRLVLQLTIIFMWVLEIIKFIILLRIHGNIPLGEFPYALCSTPLYLFPFVAFGRSKFAEYLKPAAFIVGLLAGTITLLYPSNILGGPVSWFSLSEELFPLRSFVYHTVMILFSAGMLITGIYKIKKGDLIKALVVLLVLSGFAIFLNTIIPNADFFMLGMGWGSPFAFLREISPLLYIFVMLTLGVSAITLVFLPFELKKQSKSN